MNTQLEALRQYFQSGATQSFDFRLLQLKRLKQVVLDNEQALYKALYADLKKSKEECWVTEIGILLSEIRYAFKRLEHWMKREKVKTNLLNFPSSSFVYKEPLGVVLIISPDSASDNSVFCRPPMTNCLSFPSQLKRERYTPSLFSPSMTLKASLLLLA